MSNSKQNISLPPFLAPHHPHHVGPPAAPAPPAECFIETPCTRSCGDGFKLLLPNPNGYGCYGASLQVHPCNEKPCPVDCHWGVWTPWSVCTKTGKRRRRSPLAEAAADHPVAAYGAPESVYSGICTQSRQRAVEHPPAHYGKECKGDYAETRFCQSYECPGKKSSISGSRIGWIVKLLRYRTAGTSRSPRLPRTTGTQGTRRSTRT